MPALIFRMWVCFIVRIAFIRFNVAFAGCSRLKPLPVLSNLFMAGWSLSIRLFLYFLSIWIERCSKGSQSSFNCAIDISQCWWFICTNANRLLFTYRFKSLPKERFRCLSIASPRQAKIDKLSLRINSAPQITPLTVIEVSWTCQLSPLELRCANDRLPFSVANFKIHW